MSGSEPEPSGRAPIDRTQAFRPEGDVPPPANLPQIPGITLHFELARGGMGVVYSGRQDFLDRRVAVKFLSVDLGGEKFAQRFRREAKILAGIKHPNIVACHSAGTTEDGQSYLVMEFVDGPTLKSWITKHGPVSCAAALRLCRSAVQALAHAHMLGVIHRDIKAENILLETMTSTAIDLAFPFVPKLVDLGLARMTSESAGFGLTSPGSVMGTPATMSPEQFDEPDSVDFRSDIYGLGCVLYEMLVGDPAYRGSKLTDIVTKKRAPIGPNPCAANASVSPEVGELVSSMLAANREARPSSYKELEDRLTALSASLPATSVTKAAPSNPGITGATIDVAMDGGAAKAASKAPREGQSKSPVPPSSSGPGLLRTAEFDFLAKETTGATPAPPAFRDGSPDTQGPRAAPRMHRALAFAAVVLLLGGGVGAWYAFGRTPPPEENPVVVPKPDPVPPPPVAKNLPPKALAIDGPIEVQLRRPIEFVAKAEDPEHDVLTYRWSSPQDSFVTFAPPDKASTRVQINDGLPGEKFTLTIEVRDGTSSTTLEKEVTIGACDETNLLADFGATDSRWTNSKSENSRNKWITADRTVVAYVTDDTVSSHLQFTDADDVYWQVTGEIAPRRMNGPLPAEEVGVRIEFGNRGWTLLARRTMEPEPPQHWTLELMQVSREGDTWQQVPMPEPKLAKWDVSETEVDGIKEVPAWFEVRRRLGQLQFKFGALDATERTEFSAPIGETHEKPVITLFAKAGKAGGRGAFLRLRKM